MPDSNSTMYIVIAIIGLIVIVSVLLSMWKKVPQDKAAVVTGTKKKIITGGGGLVIPILQRVDYISLGNIQIDVSTDESMSSQGVPIAVVGTAVIKVKNETNSIFNAIEQFTGRNEMQIEQSIRSTATNVLEGKLREIVSTMTVEDIYRDRETFSSKVQEVVGTELGEMGLEVKVFTIKDINDSNGYIQALGVKQIAEKKKDAEIAKAEANRETQIETSKAKRSGEQARLLAETEIAEATKLKEVQEAAYMQEQQAAKAKADAAYEIQKNITFKEVVTAQLDAELLKQERQKDIEAAQVQIQIIKEQKNIELAQKQAERIKESLRAEVVEPARADREKQQNIADAEKYRKIAEAEAQAEAQKKFAEAEAEAKRLRAIAESEAIRKTGQAEADVISQKGKAEADAIRAKGIAEAEAMEKKAEAYQKYSSAAVAEMLIQVLPDVAGKIAQPLSQIDKIVIMDGGNGSNGVSNVAGNVTGVMTQVFESLKEVTGIDLGDIVKAKGYDAQVTKNININANPELVEAIDKIVPVQNNNVEDTTL
ncbi:flotillin family protein [Clostridium sp. Marseille-P299]|uniref:flotillin family protein n=1 Tax=Clostridium sp. Marseille-P299 TaxID=1805477 RepID=UPI00082A5A29|nr:SPFH domain-containing protein [Clostridium sp. Marseille-P299]